MTPDPCEQHVSEWNYNEAVITVRPVVSNCERMTTGWPTLSLICLRRVQHLPAGHQPNVFLTASAGMIDA